MTFSKNILIAVSFLGLSGCGVSLPDCDSEQSRQAVREILHQHIEGLAESSVDVRGRRSAVIDVSARAAIRNLDIEMLNIKNLQSTEVGNTCSAQVMVSRLASMPNPTSPTWPIEFEVHKEHNEVGYRFKTQHINFIAHMMLSMGQG